MASEIWRDEYPFESKWLELSGHQYHYVDEGTSDEVILAVHGNPTWSFYYRNVVSQFRDRMRVVAVDHVGCGLSDKPQDYSYCLDQHATNLGKLIETLDLRNITLLAHDWGGAIGTLTLSRHLDRFKRIVLLNTAAFPPPFIPFRISLCRFPILGTIGVRGLNLFAGLAVKMAMSRDSLSPAAKAGLLGPYDSWNNRVAIDGFVKDIPMNGRHPTRKVLEQLERDLSEVTLPTKLIWGMKDWCFTPACLRKLQEMLPHAEALEIADAGHYVMEDAPNEVLDAMESFLFSKSSVSDSDPTGTRQAT